MHVILTSFRHESMADLARPPNRQGRTQLLQNAALSGEQRVFHPAPRLDVRARNDLSSQGALGHERDFNLENAVESTQRRKGGDPKSASIRERRA